MKKRQLRDEFKHEFNLEVQLFLLNCMISDLDIFARCRTIVHEDYFDDQLNTTVRFILQYADEQHSIPDIALINAKTGQLLTGMSPEAMVRQRDWFLQEMENFCRYRAKENVMLDAIELLRAGEVHEFERRYNEAAIIRLNRDIGTDYFHNPHERLLRMLDRSSFVKTGWHLLDDKLFGGFSRGALNVFCGSSGSGKSLVLQNLALNWILDGHLVVYFTLELSEDLVSLRLDSMLSGKSTRDVIGNVLDVALFLKEKSKVSERLFIKKMPEGSTTTNDLRAFLKEFEIQTGRRPDAIIVDYLDLMYPNNQRIDPSDLFVKDKFVSEELRGLMDETNSFGATASQLNRGAIEAQGEFDHSHIAGGISKINTADNVIAIYAPNLQRGEYTMLFLKTRSSSGVGQRIKLRYDPECMRITNTAAPDVDRAQSYNEISAELKEQNQSMDGDTALDMMQRNRGKHH